MTACYDHAEQNQLWMNTNNTNNTNTEASTPASHHHQHQRINNKMVIILGKAEPLPDISSMNKCLQGSNNKSRIRPKYCCLPLVSKMMQMHLKNQYQTTTHQPESINTVQQKATSRNFTMT